MSKHNGINATRDVLKDQLALAAEAIIALRCERDAVSNMMPRLRIPTQPPATEHLPLVIAMISAALGFLAGSVL